MKTFIIFFLFSLKLFSNWIQPPEILSATSQPTQIFPYVILQDSGRGLAVFSEKMGGYYIIYTAYTKDFGDNWKSSSFMSVLNLDSFNPKIAFKNNYAIAIWETYATKTEIQIAYSSDFGETFKFFGTISNNNFNCTNPTITMDSTGKNAIVAWEKEDGVNSIIQSSFSIDGGSSWSVVQDVSGATGSFTNPAIDLNDAGNAIIAFRENLGATQDVLETHSDDFGSSWSPAKNIDTDTYLAVSSPDVAVDTSGNGVVVWMGEIGTDIKVRSGYFSKIPESWHLSTIASFTSTNIGVTDPQLDMNDFGYAIVVWRDKIGVNKVIKSAYSRNSGLHWTASSTDVSAAFSDVENPSISINENGDGLVVYSKKVGTSYTVESSYSKNGGDIWTASSSSLSSATINSFYPNVSLNDLGYAIAIWSNVEIKALTGHFSTDHPFVVNTYQKYIRFLMQGDLTLKLTSNKIPFADHFEIYRDKNLTDLLVTVEGDQLDYILHGLREGDSYYIIWVSLSGIKSDPFEVKVE